MVSTTVFKQISHAERKAKREILRELEIQVEELMRELCFAIIVASREIRTINSAVNVEKNAEIKADFYKGSDVLI